MYRRYGDNSWDGAAADSAAATVPPIAASTPSVIAAGPADPRFRATRRPHRRTTPLPVEALPAIRLHGIRLHAITEETCIVHILSELDAGRGGMVVTPNLDHIRRAGMDLSFNALVAEADLVVPDGMPLIWASRLQGSPLPMRIAGSDLISSLSRAAADRGRSIFLLGGVPGTADGAAAILKTASPNLTVAGTYCPPYGFEDDQAEMARIETMLRDAKPDIIYVALGSPKQENLIQRIRGLCPTSWWLGVGISFSFLTGDVRRAPRWIQKIGLEWLHRLAQDPKRLFHRYVVVGIPFGLRLLARSAIKGLPNRFRSTPLPPTPVTYTMPPGSDYVTWPTTSADHNGNGNGHALDTHTTPSIARPRRRARADGVHNRTLKHLRAVILLGGSVRSSQLSESCGRSILDLPLDADGSIFNHWLMQATDLARHAGLEKLPVRVLVNRNAPEPTSATPQHYGKFRVERDLSEYRGTGGVLRDLAADYADDDLVVICNAQQVLLDPLAALATALDKKAGDFTIVAHNDGTPSGVMLASCKTLRMIPETGFVDLKEQALALIAQQYEVTVLHCRRPTALPVRTMTDYIVALRHYHGRRAGKVASTDPLSEDWMASFALVEQGALVDPRAHVHDSVVLGGAVIEGGAVVVRSIVCPGGVVKRDKHAVDQLVCVEDKSRN
jgi:N-acetylglucosaminyldiphosphoundecaprenol N-acetyl-beta-D-mannosaminyltransferase